VFTVLFLFFIVDTVGDIAASKVWSNLATPWQQFDVEHVSALGYIKSQGPVLVRVRIRVKVRVIELGL
tara:strand:+ start:513 stop:716 length:204 start_codon:yes stop_codon:yes gene_type:complete